jgi:hypothetical protein
MSSNYISDVLVAQDLEKLNYSLEIAENPSEYNALKETRIATLLNEVGDRKRTAYQKADIDMKRYMDMEHNANYYQLRNSDVQNLQTTMEQHNRQVVNAAAFDRDISKRQFEINEFYYYKKLDMLFYLQLVFIAVLLGAVLVYMQKVGIITTQFATLLTILLIASVIITGISRYYYNRRIRDHRLWHKRYFDKELPTGLESPLTCHNGEVAFDVDKILPSGTSQCAASIGTQVDSKFTQWNNDLQNEISAYQSQGAPPEGIFSDATGNPLLDFSKCNIGK